MNALIENKSQKTANLINKNILLLINYIHQFIIYFV